MNQSSDQIIDVLRKSLSRDYELNLAWLDLFTWEVTGVRPPKRRSYDQLVADNRKAIKVAYDALTALKDAMGYLDEERNYSRALEAINHLEHFSPGSLPHALISDLRQIRGDPKGQQTFAAVSCALELLAKAQEDPSRAPRIYDHTRRPSFMVCPGDSYMEPGTAPSRPTIAEVVGYAANIPGVTDRVKSFLLEQISRN